MIKLIESMENYSRYLTEINQANDELLETINKIIPSLEGLKSPRHLSKKTILLLNALDIEIRRIKNKPVLSGMIEATFKKQSLEKITAQKTVIEALLHQIQIQTDDYCSVGGVIKGNSPDNSKNTPIH